MGKISKNKLKALFKKVKLLVLDVDGVLTKGEIIYDCQGRELKIFNVKDGLGIFILSRLGIKTIIVTAKDSRVVNRRAKDMRVAQVYSGILPKESLLPKIMKKFKVSSDQICFVGDDIIDIGIMERVGLPVAVADAAELLKSKAAYITRKKGGEAAAREVVDLIVESKNLQDKVLKIISTLKKKKSLK